MKGLLRAHERTTTIEKLTVRLGSKKNFQNVKPGKGHKQKSHAKARKKGWDQ